MINENCIDCLYSTPFTLDMDVLFNKDFVSCGNENSPYYERLLDSNKTCRLFIDANERFKMEDRRENILKLKENMKFNK